MSKKFNPRSLQCSVAAAALVACAPIAAHAQAMTYAFNIPPQGLDGALRAFARASNQQVAFSGETVAGKSSAGLVGTHTADAGLRVLLAGSGLEFRRGSQGVIMVTAAAAPQVVGASAEPDEAPQAIEEVVVTGTSIRGVAPVGAPVLQISQEDMRKAPQIVNIGADESRVNSDANQATANTFRAAGVNIRGLGTQATLTLVDGQRPAPAGLLASSFDPTVIPTIALSGVDVVADGASAIYGADALAGVVNLKLRKNFDGVEALARYGFADDYYTYQVAGIVGKSWDRGSITVAGEFTSHPPFYAYSRPDLFLGVRSGVQRVPATGTLEPYYTPNAFPTNLTAGGITYALPAGGTAPLTVDQVLAGRGQRNVLSTWENTTVIPFQQRKSIVGNFNFDLTDRVELFGQAFFSRRAFNRASSSPSVPATGQTLTVRSTNPYAAFLTQLPGAPTTGTVTYSFIDAFGPTYFDGEEDQAQAMLGARVDLFGDFQFELTATQNYSHNFRNSRGGVNTCALTGQPTNVSGPCTVPGGALNQTSLATAFNPFGQNSRAVLDALGGYSRQIFMVQLRQIRAKLDGTLFELPGGGVKVAAGVDYVHQRNWYNGFSNLGSADTSIWLRNNGGKKLQDITAVFAEAVVPLVGPANARPFVQSLQLSLAGRVDKYSIYEGTTGNPKLGLTWVPVDGLSLRGSYSTSFRSGLKDIDPNNTPNVTARINSYFDYACNCSVTSLNRNGGNALVTPESSETWTLGADYRPAAVPGLSLSATYFNIAYDDIIDQPGNSISAGLTSAAQERLYGGYMLRRPPPSDVAATAAFDARVRELLAHPTFTNATVPAVSSVIIITSGQSWNAGSLRAQGIDFILDYALPTDFGDLSFGVAGTYYLQFDRSLTPADTRSSKINQINFPTRYRLRGELGWSRGRWRATGFVNYTPGYVNTGVTPQAKVASYTTVDANLSYAFEGEGALRDLSLGLNVQNLFDKHPPYALVARLQTYDSQVASPIGRMFAVELRKRF